MSQSWEELTVSQPVVELSTLLSEWRWLVDEWHRPWFVTALGDMFLERNDGRILWLRTEWGTLTDVAASSAELQQSWTDPRHAEAWLAPSLVAELQRRHGPLPPGACFSPRVPPALGGHSTPDNFEVTSLPVHFGVLGQVHRQVKELPPGTPVSEVRVVGPAESSGFEHPAQRRKQRLGGVFLATLSAGFIFWTWYTALREGYFYPKAAMIFPAFFVLGAGLVLFPDYRTERLSRGEEISHLTGSQLITPRWWGIIAVGLLAGAANWFLLSR